MMVICVLPASLTLFPISPRGLLSHFPLRTESRIQRRTPPPAQQLLTGFKQSFSQHGAVSVEKTLLPVPHVAQTGLVSDPTGVFLKLHPAKLPFPFAKVFQWEELAQIVNIWASNGG